MEPAIGDQIEHPEYRVAVGVAAEVAEHEIEIHASTQQQPRGDRRVEATGDQRHRPPLGAEGKPARPLPRLAQVIGLAAPQLDPHLDLWSLQIDPGGMGREPGSELTFELRGPQAERRSTPAAAQANGESPACDQGRKDLLAGAQKIFESVPGAALGRPYRLHAEDSRGHVAGISGIRAQEEPLPGGSDPVTDAGAVEGRGQVSSQAPGEAVPRSLGFDAQLSGVADEEKILHGQGGRLSAPREVSSLSPGSWARGTQPTAPPISALPVAARPHFRAKPACAAGWQAMGAVDRVSFAQGGRVQVPDPLRGSLLRGRKVGGRCQIY